MKKPRIFPRKPTQPFGYTAFSKKGEAKAVTFQLSEQKEIQEEEVIRKFIEFYDQLFLGPPISEVMKLPENDHDFGIIIDGKFVLIQLTELVSRVYAFPIINKEQKEINWDAYAVFQNGGPLFGIDLNKKNQALTDVINHKIQKNYGKVGNDLWLIIFCTSIYETEYHEGGRIVESEGLKNARLFINGVKELIFDKIWFFDLITRPIQIWPYSPLSD